MDIRVKNYQSNIFCHYFKNRFSFRFTSDSRPKKTVRIDYSTFNYPSKISTTKTTRIPSPE